MTKPTAGQSGFNQYQDVIGQFPSLKCYNHGLLVFPLDDDISRDEVIASLEAATAKIISQIPWLGDQVVHEGQGPGNSGVFDTAAWPIDRPKNTLIYVKDCTDLCPSYKTIAAAQAPAFMLDGQILCLFPGFPLSYREDEIGPAPVAAVQANFIRGGVILNFSNQHNMMDASGMFIFMALLATAMCGQNLPKEIVAAANLDRAKVIPLLDPDEPIRDHSHLLKPSVPPALPALPAPGKWAFFRFFKKKVPQIKAAAQDPRGFDPRVSFISTNDALSAFYWQRLAAVRLANGVDPAAVSKFSRAIDVRGAMGVPAGYMGQMVYQSATRLTYGELAGSGPLALSLSGIASRLRADLAESNSEWVVRSYATFLAGVRDKSTLLYGGGLNPVLDVGSSSMSQTTSATLSFGILGVPAFARRPNLTPLPGLMYFYPPEGDGDFPVLVCLSENDLEGLREDAEWSACTEFIG